LKELLARPDSIRITSPVLPRETLERVLAIIREDVADDKVRIDNPTQNLESYFLDVVEQAKRAQETSGATSGARVAAYLRGDAETGQSAAEKVLERLVTSQSEAPAVQEAAAAPSNVDSARLESLLKGPESSQPAPAAEPEKPADLSDADEKLSSLLGKKK
jgi:hypothetical protein